MSTPVTTTGSADGVAVEAVARDGRIADDGDALVAPHAPRKQTNERRRQVMCCGRMGAAKDLAIAEPPPGLPVAFKTTRMRRACSKTLNVAAR